MNLKKIIIYIIILFLGLWAIFIFFNQTKKIENIDYIRPEVTTSIVKNIKLLKTCPKGFILVPGNPLYKTNDFCTMKYEAKCALASNPTIGLEPAHGDKCSGQKAGHYFNTYNNSGSNCACTGNKEIVSTKSGFPIAYIPQYNQSPDNAKNYCANMGWHLMTNNEWMTIARNVEQVTDNWCDLNGTNCGYQPGTVGKILANGHNDNKNEKKANGTGSDSALVAGDDNEPCLGTTTDGTNTCGGLSSQKRTLTLNNGQIIWDLAGNVWEWTDDLVMRKDEPRSETNGVIDTGWLKSDFAPGSLKTVITDNGQGPSMGYDSFRPSDPTWNTNNGVGRIYHYSTPKIDIDTTLYAFIRGGNWKHGDDDGAFTIHLSPPPDRPLINDVGFRCVD